MCVRERARGGEGGREIGKGRGRGGERERKRQRGWGGGEGAGREPWEAALTGNIIILCQPNQVPHALLH